MMSKATTIATAPTRKTRVRPLSRSGALFWAMPNMAGPTDSPIIWKKNMAPTATPSSRLDTANWATYVLTVKVVPNPRPATAVTSTKSQIGVAAVKRHMANRHRVAMA